MAFLPIAPTMLMLASKVDQSGPTVLGAERDTRARLVFTTNRLCDRSMKAIVAESWRDREMQTRCLLLKVTGDE